MHVKCILSLSCSSLITLLIWCCLPPGLMGFHLAQYCLLWPANGFLGDGSFQTLQFEILELEVPVIEPKGLLCPLTLGDGLCSFYCYRSFSFALLKIKGSDLDVVLKILEILFPSCFPEAFVREHFKNVLELWIVFPCLDEQKKCNTEQEVRLPRPQQTHCWNVLFKMAKKEQTFLPKHR